MRSPTAVFLLAAGWGLACGQAAREWVAHKEISGFSIEAPRGWTVRADAKRGWLEVQGVNRETVVLWPVFVPGALERAAAPAILEKLSASVWADARWEPPQPLGAAVLRAFGRTGDRLAMSALGWVDGSQGSAGNLYALAAPEPAYRQSEETFARILTTYRVAGTPAGSEAAAWVRWQDPREGAFSVEVPRTWKTSGGMFRFASVDTRAAFETVSPDGQIRITSGDADLPTFSTPNPILTMTGFREGSWYSPGYGVNFIVRRYLTGAQFARYYVEDKAARDCADLTFTHNRDRPDAAQTLGASERQLGAPGIQISLSVGEAAFTCRKGGQPFTGYYFAGTHLVQTPETGTWHVRHLKGFLAPSARAAEAQQVFDRVVRSVQVDTHWYAGQVELAAYTSRIVSRTQEEISEMITRSYWRRQRMLDEWSHRRSHATLGIDRWHDRHGRGHSYEYGPHRYWLDHRGRIYGTDRYSCPSLDFRGLLRR